ncbi:hypothetical protein V2P20_12655 [Methylobacter sp. Wu1]|uniref:hypothetical protein n=1 Tax=Methylobacter sp. Wu1 TaxID=3119359 RepID=UPI002F948184
MMDKLILVLVAILVSAGAWFFWHEAQTEGFNIITLVTILVLGTDNYRLRKTIKSLGETTSRDRDQ